MKSEYEDLKAYLKVAYSKIQARCTENQLQYEVIFVGNR